MAGLFYEDFHAGQKIVTVGRTITESDIVTFAGLSGDYNQLHTDAEFSRQGSFGQRIAHGLLGLSITSGLALRTGFLEGTVIAFREISEWKFTKPVFIGDTIHAGPRAVTLQDIEHFAEFTGDTFYAHMDEAAAAKNPFFGGRVAHGYLIVSLAAGLFVQPDYGPVLANYGIDNLRFLTPVKPGDEIAVTLTCKQISPRSGDYGEVRWDAELTNQEGKVVATYDVLTMVAKEWTE